ncbi:helix-turn-helix transcriptional regulator [Treponema phagedenis]|uniref:helix-turn-helix transcriptional regulator n=1 Tax=Treponema phagedenis TaxID=162 RepID=UPI001FCFDEAD|nr:WYL domain-containing protein [Treponema phagedenis]
MDKKEGRLRFWRILQLDEVIRTKKYPTLKTLVQVLGVSARTVQRDIEFLRDMYNAPIEYDHTRRGYFYTENTFFLKSVFLNEEEFFSVAIFEKLLRQYRNTPIEKLLQDVFEKILSIMPDKAVCLDTCWLDNSVTFIADPAPNINNQTFSSVFKAVKVGMPIGFLYRSLKTDSYEKRKINPYHIICQRGVWYVIGFCHTKNDLRIFSFSRIKDLHLFENEKFEVPADFNPEKYIDKNIGVWLTKREPFTVRLLFSSEVGVFAEERMWSKDQKLKVHDDKTVEVSFKTTQLEEIKRFVLGQGANRASTGAAGITR